MTYAVIDIGSNSVRLMLTDGKRTSKELNTTRIGEGMGDGKRILLPEAMERTARAVAAYA